MDRKWTLYIRLFSAVCSVTRRLAVIMDECVRTLIEPKESYNLVFTGTSSEITIDFEPQLYLNKKRTYELALINLETYYSFPNIDATNNRFQYSKDNGLNWIPVTIPIGCYEIRAINKEIMRQIPNKAITIKPNKNTLQSILTIADRYIVDFTTLNCLASVLGFDKRVYKKGVHLSQHIVNILRINSILVNCNIITGSYLNGKEVPTIANFFPNVRPGDKIVYSPVNVIYVPVTVDVISHLTAWLTDQTHTALNLREERLTIRLHLRER